MLTVSEFKEYARIPYDDDDGLITSFIEVAYAYLRNAIQDFDELFEENENFSKQANLFVRFYVAELYDNREQMQGEKNPSYMCLSLMTQLQLYERGK